MEGGAVGHNFERDTPRDHPIAALVKVKMSSNFNCSYMARSSLGYILGFSVKYFFQPIYTDYAN
jgi:hypothetical protein